jgi:hypothetical protein
MSKIKLPANVLKFFRQTGREGGLKGRGHHHPSSEIMRKAVLARCIKYGQATHKLADIDTREGKGKAI